MAGTRGASFSSSNMPAELSARTLEELDLHMSRARKELGPKPDRDTRLQTFAKHLGNYFREHPEMMEDVQRYMREQGVDLMTLAPPGHDSRPPDEEDDDGNVLPAPSEGLSGMNRIMVIMFLAVAFLCTIYYFIKDEIELPLIQAVGGIFGLGVCATIVTLVMTYKHHQLTLFIVTVACVVGGAMNQQIALAQSGDIGATGNVNKQPVFEL